MARKSRLCTGVWSLCGLAALAAVGVARPALGQTILFTADTDSTPGTNAVGAPADSNGGHLPPISAGVTLAPNPARLGGVLTGPLGGISYGPGVEAGGTTKGGTTGFVTVTHAFAASGNVQLTWEVSDVYDYDIDSALAIDNVRLNGTLLFGFETGVPAGFISLGNVGTSVAVTNLSPREGTRFAYMDTRGTVAPIFDPYDGTGGSRLVSSPFAVSFGAVLTMDVAFLTRDGCTSPSFLFCHDYGAAMVAFVSGACGNGVLEPGEDCDDGNTANGDCCSATCTFEFASDPCQLDGNLCTSDECDGNGSCVFAGPVNCFPSIPPCEGGETCSPALGCVAAPDAPPSTACEADANLCTIDHCNGSGYCIFGSAVQCAPPVPPCESGAACNSQTGACNPLPDAPAGTLCADDGNLCTTDRCNGTGACRHDCQVGQHCGSGCTSSCALSGGCNPTCSCQ